MSNFLATVTGALLACMFGILIEGWRAASSQTEACRTLASRFESACYALTDLQSEGMAREDPSGIYYLRTPPSMLVVI